MPKFDAIASITVARLESSQRVPENVKAANNRPAAEHRDQQCQAKLFVQTDAECQATNKNDAGVQAEPSKISSRRSSSIRQAELSRITDFVNNVTPMFLEALAENLQTEAFVNWRMRAIHHSHQVSELCQLNAAKQFETTTVSQVSWNASGSLLGVAYGGFSHEAFCTHRAGIVVYKVLRFSSGQKEPFCMLDTQNCVMCIAFNPKSPTLLAAGTFSGEIIVWDLETAGENKIIATTGIIPDLGHREPISALCWMLKDMASVEAYQLFSCSLDGKAILWKKPAGGSKELRPHVGLMLVSDDLVRAASKFTLKLPKGGKPVGITAMAYTRDDNSTFVIGSENGAILRCKRSGLKADIKEGLSYAAALSIGYRSNSGPTTDLCFSPHSKDIFIAAATDGALKLFHVTSATPVLELKLTTAGDNFDSLLCCDYSPARPSVFAVGTSSGAVLIFDLMQNLSEPVMRLYGSGGEKGIACDTVQFNLKQHNLLASGNRLGTVTIWTLPESLTDPDAGESNAFAQFVQDKLK